ncbi:hypothetical protein E2C01_025798 [Portunus trituberculatus]|uniref:Uncharacterized protein n=1 Tax=Portunus trituberculatus TaxID=210409 RepID=A0A5B7EGP9_PORTR|nr:hypothetical protein [Portunus trituberculatus]
MKRLHPLHLPDLQPLSVTPEEFGQLQRTCDTLTIACTKAAMGEIDQARNNSTFQFLYQDGLLYRNPTSASSHLEDLNKVMRQQVRGQGWQVHSGLIQSLLL